MKFLPVLMLVTSFSFASFAGSLLANTEAAESIKCEVLTEQNGVIRCLKPILTAPHLASGLCPKKMKIHFRSNGDGICHLISPGSKYINFGSTRGMAYLCGYATISSEGTANDMDYDGKIYINSITCKK